MERVFVLSFRTINPIVDVYASAVVALITSSVFVCVRTKRERTMMCSRIIAYYYFAKNKQTETVANETTTRLERINVEQTMARAWQQWNAYYYYY